MVDHKFGNKAWTELKLNVIKDYLPTFTTVLKENRKYWDLVYIDAFAGTGSRVEEVTATGLLKDKQYDYRVEYDGSAKIALETNPPFDHFVFIEKNRNYFEDLNKLCKQYPYKITIYKEDANVAIPKVIKELESSKYRAVVFLDPYNLSVTPDTLKCIANTEKIDVWYLFAIRDLARQLATDYSKIENHKKRRLDHIFKGYDWRTIYKEKNIEGPYQAPLFNMDGDEVHGLHREKGIETLEKWLIDSFLSDIFPLVVDQTLRLPLYGPQHFTLILCGSNPNNKAMALVKKIGEAIIKKRASLALKNQ